MADYSAGSASIKINPNLRDFVNDLRRDLSKIEATYGVEIVPEMRDFSRELETRLSAIEARYSVGVDPDLDGFAARLEAELSGIEASIPVDLDLGTAEARLDALADDRRVTVDVDADTGLAQAQIDGLVANRSVNVNVNANTAAASTAIDFAARNRTSRIDLDTSGFMAAVGRTAAASGIITGITGAVGGLAGLLGVAGGAVGGLGVGIIGLGTTALPIIGAIALGVDGIKEAAAEAKPEFDALKSAMSEAFSTELAGTFRQLGDALGAWTPALTSVGSSVAGVMDGFLGVFSSAQGIPIVTEWLGGTALMTDQLRNGFVMLGGGIRDLMATSTPYMTQMGAGFSDLIGLMGGAFTVMGQLGILDSIFANLGPAVSGVGEGIAGLLISLGQMGSAVLPVVGPLFHSLGQAFLNMGPALGQAGAVMGTVLGPVLENLGTFIGSIATQLSPLFSLLGQALNGIMAGLTPVLPILSQLGQVVLGALTPILPILSQVLQTIGTALTGALAAVAPAIQPLAQAFSQVVSALAPLLPLIGTLIGTVVSALAPALGQIAQALAPVIATLATAFVPIWQSLGPILAQVAGVLAQVAGQLAGVLLQAITQITPFLPMMVQAFSQILTAVLPLVPQLVQLGVTMISALLPAILQMVPQGVAMMQMFAGIVQAVAPLISALISVIQWVANISAAIIGFVTNAGGSLSGFWGAVTSGFSGMISTVIGAVTGWVSSMVGKFVELVSAGRARATELWSQVQNAFSTGVSRAVSLVNELPGRITRIFASAGSWLVSAGRDVVSGLINGITSMMGTAIEQVRNLGSKIAATAREALAIFSPSRVFMEIGRFVSQGLAIGIDQAADQPVTSVSGMVGKVAGAAAEQFVGDTGQGVWNLVANRDYDGRLRGVGVEEDNPLVDLGLAAFDARRRINTAIATAAPGLFAGAGGPRDDANLIRISNGEFVVNAEATDEYLPLLHAINSGMKIPGFVEGGAIGRTVNEMRPLHGLPYVYGGSSGRSWDCSGLSSGAFNGVIGKGINAGRKFTTESNFEGLGFVRGKPPADLMGKVFFVGVSRGGGGPNSHMAAHLGNVPIESSSSGVRIGSGTRGALDPSFNLHWWLPPNRYSPPGTAEPRKANIPGMIPVGGGTAATGDPTAAVMPTGAATAATSQSPTSWSQVAGIGAKAFAEGQVKDALGVLGIPDSLPPVVKAATQLDAALNAASGAAEPAATAVKVPAGTVAAPAAEMGGGSQDAALRHVYNPAGGAEQWRPTVAAVYNIAGWPLSNVDRAVKQIKIESGGNPRAKNMWDSNAKKGTPSEGLLQTIRPTFDAMRAKFPKIAGFANSMSDGPASIGAGTGWAYHRYGGPEKVWPTTKGYAVGGPVTGGTGVHDDVLIRAMGGEYMVRRRSAEAAGPLLHRINSSPSFAARANAALSSGSLGSGDRAVQSFSSTYNITAADTQDAYRQSRLEDHRSTLTHLGGR